MSEGFIHFLHRWRYVLAPFFIAVFCLAIMQAKKLELRSNFKELLPETYQSVKDMERIGERVISTDSLIVAIETEDSQAAIRFANDLIKALEKLPPEYIHQIDYNAADIRAYFEKNKYLYAELEDLEEMHDRFKRRIEREKVKGSGLFLDLETEEEKEQEFSTKDLEDKYGKKTSAFDGYIDGYFFGEEGKLMAIILRPPGAATGTGFAKDLVAKVEETIAQVNPKKYHASIKTGLTGKFRRVLFEYQTLIDDIVSTAVLVIVLVGLVVFLYFWRLRMVFLMGWTVVSGVAWTFAATYYKIGYLTTQTGFLGAIIVGNGINYSLILMARYMEERRRGHGCLESLQISIPKTIEATLASSATTAVGFATLLITDVRGFAHFGFIGGLGMFACWVATYVTLPIFLAITEDIRPIVKKGEKAHAKLSFMKYLANKMDSWEGKILKSGLVLSILSAIGLAIYIPNAIEYDFSKLRVKPQGDAVSEEQALNDRVRKLFSDSMSPAVLVTDTVDEVQPLCEEVLRKRDMDPIENQVIGDCRTVYSYVPPQQEEKLATLGRIYKLLEDDALQFLNETQKKEVTDFQSNYKNLVPLTLEDVPEKMLRNFREKDGSLGKVAFVYPTDKAPLWDGKNLIRFADIIRENKLPNGKVITASGTQVIFADLLAAMTHDGPVVTLLSFFAVSLVVALFFRQKRAIFFIVGTLIFGILWMGGLMALFSIKLNFFNFIAIPITLGIGIDYGVNIWQRYKLDGPGSMSHVIQTTGGAVVLCSLTSILGYLTLIIAKNQALVSFGWIGIVGETTCVFGAILFAPTLINRLDKKHAPKHHHPSSSEIV